MNVDTQLDTNEAHAAPSIPIIGINEKFRIMLMTKPAKLLMNVNLFLFLIIK